MTLDPKALEAARRKAASWHAPEFVADNIVNAYIAALAALPQAEPVAWIDRRLLKSMHGPSVAALSATVYSNQIDDNHVGLFASPTPAVSREVTEEIGAVAKLAEEIGWKTIARGVRAMLLHSKIAALSQPHSEK